MSTNRTFKLDGKVIGFEEGDTIQFYVMERES